MNRNSFYVIVINIIKRSIILTWQIAGFSLHKIMNEYSFKRDGGIINGIFNQAGCSDRFRYYGLKHRSSLGKCWYSDDYARYCPRPINGRRSERSEEHTSELQSRGHLV